MNGRYVLAGSGGDGFGEKSICEAAVGLVAKKKDVIRVVYLGTATYDAPDAFHRQTIRFTEMGCCDVRALLMGASDAKDVLESADIVVVSGGNTLFAIGTWRRAGIDVLLKDCLARGVVLCGGSAGAICWFDAGHSDSMDPQSFREKKEPGPWSYIRISGLGFLPGMLCPHHDKVQTNGVPRASDFDEMLRRHEGESGIGIDHWAALVVDGPSGTFRVLSVEGKTEGGDVPGVLLKQDGVTRAVPETGRVTDIFRAARGPIVVDPREAICQALNPPF